MKNKSLNPLCALALAGTLLIPSIGFAQQGGPGNPDKGMSPEARLEKMKSNLGLSPEQAESIKAIMTESKASMDKILEDASLSADQKKAQGREIRQASKTKIDAVLTPEQKEKMKSQRPGPKGEKSEKPKKAKTAE